jgi:hypothetical protein
LGSTIERRYDVIKRPGALPRDGIGLLITLRATGDEIGLLIT